MATSYITDFVQSLNLNEITIIKEYISTRHSVIKEKKIEKLFEFLIDDKKQYTDSELCKLLQSNPGAIRVLKSRLFDVIKEAITSNKYFENDQVFDIRESAFFDLKKKAILVKAIFRKLNERKVTTINKLILDIIHEAERFQFYDILVEVLIIQKHMVSIRKGLPEYNKIHHQIEFYDKCYKAVQNANDAYYRVIINQNFITLLTKNQRILELKNAIKTLQKDYLSTKAEEVNYYRYILTLALYEFENNYKEAIICCKKLIIILRRNSITYSTRRMGYAFGNLAIFHIYLKAFGQAVTYAKKAYKFLIPNSLEYTNNREIEFLANFHNQHYSNATQVLDDLISHSLQDIGKFRASLYKYYQACIAFSTNKCKETLQLLNQSLEIEKDKATRNIAIRILLAMTFIVLEKKDEARTVMGSLRKHIERNGKTKEIKERDILIFKLLRELEKDNFFRNEHNKKAAALLAELSDKNKPTAWNYFTPELIPFHEWVMGLPVKPTNKTIKQI